MKLLEVLPFIVCEHMWLISISRKHDANNKSNSEKMWFSANFISVCGKTQFRTFWCMLCKQKLEVNVAQSSED